MLKGHLQSDVAYSGLTSWQRQCHTSNRTAVSKSKQLPKTLPVSDSGTKPNLMARSGVQLDNSAMNQLSGTPTFWASDGRMSRLVFRFTFIALLVCITASFGMTSATAQPVKADFRTYHLSGGAQITLPASWRLLDASVRTTIQESAAALIESSPDLRGNDDGVNLLVAHSLPVPMAMQARVSRKVHSPYSARDLRSLTAEDLTQLGKIFSDAMNETARMGGAPIVQVLAPRVESVNGHPALVFSYIRASVLDKNRWHVTQYHIPRGKSLVTLTLSYKSFQEPVWEPIARKIVGSFDPGS